MAQYGAPNHLAGWVFYGLDGVFFVEVLSFWPLNVSLASDKLL